MYSRITETRKGDTMIRKLYIFQGTSLDPYYNLALERRLLERVGEGECILYLWQNQNTVVIGRNQNAWVECRTSLLEEEGGHLARRLSGGGAVFHDVGNLNFTFLLRDEDYDVDRQLSVIREACALEGIRVQKSGRNDLLVEGKKFSGNAFYHHAGHAYHHGTLMIHVDKDKLSRYLSPSKAKLEAKGVASVRSRVVNLAEFSESLTCSKMRILMVRAFERVYGLTASELVLSEADLSAIEAYRVQHESWEFLFGAPLPFTFRCEGRFPWGGMELQLKAVGGRIQEARVYSDAMDAGLAPTLEQALTGCPFRMDALEAAIRTAVPETAEDICTLLKQQQI